MDDLDADKLIAITDQAMDGINNLLREEMSNYTDDEVLAYAKRLMAEPHANLLRLIATRPQDTIAMIAVHYYQEYFRRTQVKAMEWKDA